jgi:hypothetical protein
LVSCLVILNPTWFRDPVSVAVQQKLTIMCCEEVWAVPWLLEVRPGAVLSWRCCVTAWSEGRCASAGFWCCRIGDVVPKGNAYVRVFLS